MLKALLATLFFLCVALAQPVRAQCPMCKANVEAAMKNPKNKVGKGLNTGILYLLVVPYALAGGAALLWYRNYRKQATSS